MNLNCELRAERAELFIEHAAQFPTQDCTERPSGCHENQVAQYLLLHVIEGIVAVKFVFCQIGNHVLLQTIQERVQNHEELTSLSLDVPVGPRIN